MKTERQWRKRDRRTNKQAGERTCLRCGRTFGSDGPFNRMCSHCKASNAEMGEQYRVQFG